MTTKIQIKTDETKSQTENPKAREKSQNEKIAAPGHEKQR